ncbi:hypothetical protein N431DRAFT_494218 [Stipitochalara longipes BDJ]|nr:hypothetical protein N431DRAFT_494218 [Stipitochalara longipes BDJ]
MRTLKFGTDLWDPSHRFETSWILKPWVLFGCRATISLYAFTTTFFIIGWEATNHDGLSIHDVHRSFSFFTILCYWGASFYFLVSALHTFTYAQHGGTPLLNRFPRPLQALHYLFYSTIVTFPFLVTIVYWAILYSSFASRFTLWSNTSQHALNSVFGLFELVFTRINPSPWIHLLWLIILLAAYLGVAYVTYATKHYYVYSFLNPNPRDDVVVNGVKTNEGGVGKGGVVGYVLGIAAAIVIIFCLSKGLQWLRKWVTERKLGMQGKFYAGRGMGNGEVELERVRVWEKPPGET